jgi:hypothetical protein
MYSHPQSERVGLRREGERGREEKGKKKIVCFK